MYYILPASELPLLNLSFPAPETGRPVFGTSFSILEAERLSGQSKETGLVIYLAFLANVANVYYIILTAFKKY